MTVSTASPVAGEPEIAFACDALLDALRFEIRRERRRGILFKLEAHGAPARAAAAARLAKPPAQPEEVDDWYFRRNLLHLLRRIPRAGDDPVEADVDLAMAHARVGLPSVVVKEAVGLLGQIRHARSESALIRLLDEVEDMLQTRESYSETRNLPAVADRVAAALAAFPSDRARRAVISHAERAFMESGRPMASLAALGHYDLSSDEATVDRLIGIIRRGRLSRLSRRLRIADHDEDHDHIVPVIEALAATPLPLVLRTFERIARRHPTRSSGRAAARALLDLRRHEKRALAWPPPGAAESNASPAL